MRRVPLLVAAALLGLVVGGLTTLAVQATARAPAPTPAAESPATPGHSERATVEPVPVPGTERSVLLVWTAGRLPEGLADTIAALPAVERTTVVAGDRVDLVGVRAAKGSTVLDLEQGWSIPLDALAIDPASYAGIVPLSDERALAGLGPGEAILGATSAQLREAGPGAVLELADGTELSVRAVVDDTVVGAAELVVARDAAIGIDTDRFLLLTHGGDRGELEAAIRRLTDAEVRVRGPGETPYLRHGDAVLPQALIKREFGEFAYQPGPPGRIFEQSREWAAEHLVTTEVPILGTVTCHRAIVAQLTGALGELEERGLAHLVDPDTYAGCHNPRLVSDDGGVSRHAWGIAVDVNADENPTGIASAQDHRLVESFTRWGFTWGGFWLVPDPMHLEYIGPPRADPGKFATGD